MGRGGGSRGWVGRGPGDGWVGVVGSRGWVGRGGGVQVVGGSRGGGVLQGWMGRGGGW